MTVPKILAEGGLSLDQWRRVQELGRTLGHGQARWLSGYFAGLDAGLSREVETAAPAAATTRTLTLLYGTETGNARELGRALAAAAAELGLAPQLVDMSDYKVRQLKDEQDLLVIVSTYGEGDPPQPAIGFFEYLEGNRAPRLAGLRFSVLALGDSTYEKYCEAGKRIDRRLEALGAERLHARVDCDLDYEEPAAAWSGQVLARLAAGREASAAPTPAAFAAPAFVAASAHSKRNPFPAAVLENIAIVGRHSSKETRHIELDLAGSGLVYQPGDSLGIAAVNDPAVVAALLDAAGLAGDAPVAVKGETHPLAEALTRDYEIAIATPRFLDQWAKLSGAAELEALRGDDKSKERQLFLHGHHVVDIVRRFPVPGIDAPDLLAGLRPLQPRLYSLASSLAAAADEAHLTLAPVRYELHGEPRSGVASALLADRIQPGETLPVYVQENPHFRLPDDDVAIVMVGAGTGVAPYRAFLQEREARGAGGRSWLFFGERNFRSDFLYQAEWQAWLKAGLLGRIDVAFSRDGPDKVYVQRRMIERGAELYSWLEDGAHLYVCGDATAMAPDVHEALIQIVMREGQAGREAAEEYLRGLASAHRYQRDVY